MPRSSSLMKIMRRATRGGGGDDNAGASTPEDDAKYVRRFSLPENEVIASSARCQLVEGKRAMHGTLYVSKNYACFVSRIFGSEVKRVWAWRQCGAEPVRGDDGLSVLVVHNGERHLLRFQTNDSVVGLYLLMCDLWQRRPTGDEVAPRRISSGSMAEAAAAAAAVADERMLHLTQYDWDLILDGATMRTFKRDEVVVAQGDRVRRIYQIGVGRCRVEARSDDGTARYLGSMQQPDMFGEVTFLGADDGVGASVTVVADDDEGVDVYIIEASYIDLLFVRDAQTEGSTMSGLAGRFYNFLASHLSRRIRQREAETLASLQN
jgi:hypothetical protein